MPKRSGGGGRTGRGGGGDAGQPGEVVRAANPSEAELRSAMSATNHLWMKAVDEGNQADMDKYDKQHSAIRAKLNELYPRKTKWATGNAAPLRG